jgi:hypothetical protein
LISTEEFYTIVKNKFDSKEIFSRKGGFSYVYDNRYTCALGAFAIA